MNKDLESAVQKISEGYRGMLNDLAVVEEKILNIRKEMLDKTIQHGRFMDLQKQKEELEIGYKQMSYIADGVAQAREMVFSLM